MNTRNLLALLALGGVLVLVYLSREHTSPGPLASVHAREALGDVAACAQCHGEVGADLPMSASCSSCHEPISESIEQRRGLHGTLDPELADDCARCHGEHRGADFALVSETSFVRAGFTSMEAYDHSGLGFGLDGAHAALRCERCHDQAMVAVLPVQASRFLGLEPRCASCHEDPHAEAYGDDCAACHGQSNPFPEMDGFEHQTFCPLVGAHAEVDCQACHEVGSESSVAALVQRPAELSGDERDCASCHVSPHDEAFLAGIVADGVDVGMSCATCHAADHPGFQGDLGGSMRELHAATAFALDGPHAELDCAECHPGFGRREALRGVTRRAGEPMPSVDLAPFLADFPGRQPDVCVDCHGDPHRAQFDDGPFAASSCLDCHERHAFAPSTFDTGQHALASFTLEGAHAGVECARCHQSTGADAPADRAALRFDAAPSACAECHESPHAASYLEGVADSLQFSSGAMTCAVCHDAVHEGFAGLHGELSTSLHDLTGFELTAPHAELTCAECHVDFGESKFAGSAGADAFAESFPGRSAESCDVCHADPHEGQFDPGPFGAAGCLACHDAESFQPSAFGEAQHAFTRFPLEGAHRAVSCLACHRKAGESAPGGFTSALSLAVAPPVSGGTARLFAGTPTDCAACHTDVHEGEFEAPDLPTIVDGRTSCARCHGVEAFTDFSAGRFDHALWTDFSLEGAHAAADCQACHVPRRFADPNGRSFGRAPGSECSACHAVGGIASPTDLEGR